MNLRAVDLNLLTVLHVLLAEESVTRAAVRLNLTQPATSAALARLRGLFGDPLLLRRGPRLTPTSRAVALKPALEALLQGAERLLSPPVFDPARADHAVTLTASDLAEMILLPPVLAGLAQEAPRLRLIVRSSEALPADSDEALRGGVDLTFAGIDLPAGHYLGCDLYEEHFVLLARHRHPALRGDLSPDGFAALPQAIVSPRGRGSEGPVDGALARLGLKRHVAVTVTRFISLPAILAASDLVAAVPARFAARSEVQAVAGSRPLPFPSPRFTMRLAWHRLQEADVRHRWLRGRVREILARAHDFPLAAPVRAL